ncbi:phage tail tape measure C-terminal domain-containing protein [Magnetovibrio sp.]|uniref:phage tail tape measure C-terminal domain-containing protein n=1 Tax=Magnetovibrio sp. TaxID=2024836 RepID=UPI002F95DBC0
MSEQIQMGITLKADANGLVGEVRLSTAELEKFGKEAKKAGKNADRGAQDIDKLGRKSKSTAREAKLLNEQTKRMGQSFNGAERRARMLHAAMLALATGMAARVVKSFIDAASVSEQYRVRLEVMLGSIGEANRLFKDMADFAGRVPFQYQEIMSAATQLSGVVKGGVEEVKRWMPLIADLAAASGLPIQQATEQVIRMMSAGAASADLFRERGVLAMLGFQAGVSYSAQETQRMLFASWEAIDSKFKGATAKLANTWAGITSMMGDKWFQYQNMVMDSGPYDFLKAAFQSIDDEFTTNADGVRQHAQEMGQDIVKMATEIMLGTARIVDAVSPAVDTIWDGISDIWDGYRQLPEFVREWGLIGALFLGKKGMIVLGALSYANKHMSELGAGATEKGGAFESDNEGMGAWDSFSQWWDEKQYDFNQSIGRDVSPIVMRMLDRQDQTNAQNNPGADALPTLVRGAGNQRDGGIQPPEQTLEARTQAVVDGIFARMAQSQAARTSSGAEAPSSPPVASGPGHDLKTTKDITREFQKLSKTYEQAADAAMEWRNQAMAGLDETAEGYTDFSNQVEQVYTKMLADAREEDLRSSREWSAGVTRGLKDIADEAGDMASHTEQAMKNLDRAGETAFTSLMRGTTSLSQSFAKMADSIIDDILRIFYKTQISQPIAGFLGSVDWGSLFEFGGGGTGVSEAGTVSTNVSHGGGMAGQSQRTRNVSPDLFANAPRFHNGYSGLRRGEVPTILEDTEEVLTRSDPRHRYNLGAGAYQAGPVVMQPQFYLNIDNRTGGEIEASSVKATARPDGGFDLDVMIDKAVENSLTNGRGKKALHNTYGMTPSLISRG